MMSAHNNVDVAQVDFSKPLPEVSTEGHRSTLEAVTDGRFLGRPLRETVEAGLGKTSNSLELVGSPTTITPRAYFIRVTGGVDPVY
jgi:hypothetical protein